MSNPNEIYFQNHDRNLITDPERMSEWIDADTLAEPGRLLVSDAINFYEEFGRQSDGRPLEDYAEYPIKRLRLDSEIPGKIPHQSSSSVIEGDEYEGTAVAVHTALPAKLAEATGWGPLVRIHSACGNSEWGRRINNLFYKNPAWFYENRSQILPMYTVNNGNIITGYPNAFADDESIGDVFAERSEDCDCRAQRKLSQRLIAAMGGIYISLAGRQHEGRGLGPEIKEEIYRLREEEGLDTVEATQRLGVNVDERRYGHVAKYLARTLKLERVCLLGNNPRKKAALEAEGIETHMLNMMIPPQGEETAEYLRTKATKLGHEIVPGYANKFAFDREGRIWVTMTRAEEVDSQIVEYDPWNLKPRAGTILRS